MLRTAVVLVLTACVSGPAEVTYVSSSNAGTTNTLPSNTATPSASPDVHSVWRGSYTCPQGATALRLSFDRTCGRGESELWPVKCTIDGVFEFGPLPENPGVPHGSYRVTGVMSGNKVGEYGITVVPGVWIDRPDGYEMVGFHAATDASNHRMDGRIDHSECDRLSLTRVQ